MKTLPVALLLATLALALAPMARAGGPHMLVGAAEDIVQQPTLDAAKAQMDLARMAGLDAIRVTSTWSLGVRDPSSYTVLYLTNAAKAAQLDGVELVLAVYPYGSSQTPLTAQARGDFAAYAASLARALPSVRRFIVGNEPNLNRFWLPQFGPEGQDEAAAGYEALLAQTYDALKAVSPKIQVIGGAVSPRGGDQPGSKRPTHSPTTFIPDLGAAYRASGRTKPIMDALAFHPYPDENATPVGLPHPNTTSIGLGDYGKLRSLLQTAFRGTAQPATLPILYAELGIEAQIPASHASAYTGHEPATVHPVTEAVQAKQYRDAMALAFCQPQAIGLFIFHTVDEKDLDRFQSGVYYADGTPKSSLPVVRAAASRVHRGVIARCPGMHLTPSPVVRFPRGAELRLRQLPIRLTCDIDCRFVARLEKLPKHSTVVVAHGLATGGFGKKILLPRVRPAPGAYRLTLKLVAPVNPGPPAVRASSPFAIGRS